MSAIGLTSQAAFLKPTEVVYVSTGADGAPAMIDDANLSDPPGPTSTHPEGSGQWTGPGSTKQEIALDLGQTVSLTKIYLWNYLGNTTVGLKDVEVQVSPDATYATANFTAVARIFMTEGGEGVQTFNIVATDARLVRLKILGNWGQGFTVGLGSVRFETGTIVGHVPSVKVTSPTQGDTLTVGSDSIIAATVTDADNDIAKVEFFDGTKLLGTDTNAPYSITVTGGFLFGEHEIRAQATDKSGKVAWSSVNVTAREDSGGKIIQIDDNRDIGDGVNQIKYSDGWNLAPGEASDPRFLQNDHYSFTKDSYFEVKFSGSKIEIYATVASHHGLGTASIDGGDPVDISYAAEQRGEQKFIWASPTLPNRQHTLRVTVKSGAVVTADRFDVTVPSTKIIQIDDNRDIGDGVNQIKYSDGWNLAPGEASDPRFLQNDHYSFTKDSYFEVKFVGTKIDIYATVASHHGLGTATIDGGDPVDISYAAEQRGEQKFIWSSPTLPNRQHILRVTVKSGAVVTADRFDITVPATRIVVIDDNADIGEGVNQIKYSDGWTLAPGEASDPRYKQNDHYSFTKDSYFEVKFVGTKIELYATVASHHGLGTATIDGGDPVDISYAAEQRGEQKFIWASPELPNREHILRVTVKSGAVVTADRFDITVPENSVTVIDDNADIGEGVNQIKYSDGWTLAPGEASDPRYKQNDHYSFTKDSYFEVKFFGTKIELYATVASHHGLGSAQIDNGAAVDISYAAAQRGEQKFIWASPVLPNRLHVLRVTVKSGAVVTADRFDIFSSAGASGDLAGISKIVVKPGSFQIDFKDYETSIVDAPTMELRIDSVKVSAPPKKVGDTTTLLFVPAARFLAGSVHTYLASGRDTLGNTIASQGSFTVPNPPFSESGLGGPKGSAGNWGFRTVWNTGLVNNLEGAVETAGKPSLPGFLGKVHDTTVKVINMGESTNPNPPYGLFADEAPLPAESQSLTANDFVVISHGYVKIPTAGDWTIGVHSDEGFGLRFIGAPFDSVSGGGLIDPSYPEYMFNGNNTTDSNTRGILKNLAVGVYPVEFIGWERLGAAHYEIFAAKGAFVEDADTSDWKLIGEAGGLELVQGPAVPPVVHGITLIAGKAVIGFTSEANLSENELTESLDLKSWNQSTGVTFAKGPNNLQTATVTVGPIPKFYRIRLP